MNLDFDLKELKETYEKIREILLENAERLNLDPEYAYENESEKETPEGFNYFGHSFSIRDSRLFEVMVRGNLDNLKELLDDPELFSKYLEEAFGTKIDYLKETQKNIEEERGIEDENLREAA